MQTHFSPAQLSDPDTATAESVIRKCVHCGFCLSTCPTYVLLGDELDSPRGRIYLMKDMLENERTPSPEVVRHVDRCLSCLSCATTCPSGVDYRRLVDHSRAYIEARHTRALSDRLIRGLLAYVLPNRTRFRVAATLGRIARPLAPLFAKSKPLKPLAAMLQLAPATARRSAGTPSTTTATAHRGRIILLQGCVEPEVTPRTRAAAARLLTRAGYEIVTAQGEACCGALVHHLGREDDGLAAARRNVAAWTAEIDRGDVAAIVVTASGCGSQVKDYGALLRHDRVWAERAAKVSALARDITELALDLAPPQAASAAPALKVAWQAPCSLQHGQHVRLQPRTALEAAGFTVVEPVEPHLCCGSAGTYNILQPDLSERLLRRKLDSLNATTPDVIATANVGCQTQLARQAKVPVVHIVELLDWASGGPRPAGL